MAFRLILFMIFLTSCASKNWREKEFDLIKPGMLKADVIEVAGPPSWSEHKYGQDRWIYFMQPQDRDTERLVFFEGGKVVSKGRRPKQLMSAETVDFRNKKKNANVKFKPKYTDEQLKKILKKEVEKKSPQKKKENFEPI